MLLRLMRSPAARTGGLRLLRKPFGIARVADVIPREGSRTFRGVCVLKESRQALVPLARLSAHERLGIDLKKLGSNPFGQPDMPIGLPEMGAFPPGLLGIHPQDERISRDAHRNRPCIVGIRREMHEPTLHGTQSLPLNGAKQTLRGGMVESLGRNAGVAGRVAGQAVAIPGANLVLLDLEAVGVLTKKILQFVAREVRGAAS